MWAYVRCHMNLREKGLDSVHVHPVGMGVGRGDDHIVRFAVTARTICQRFPIYNATPALAHLEVDWMGYVEWPASIIYAQRWSPHSRNRTRRALEDEGPSRRNRSRLNMARRCFPDGFFYSRAWTDRGEKQTRDGKKDHRESGDPPTRAPQSTRRSSNLQS